MQSSKTYAGGILQHEILDFVGGRWKVSGGKCKDRSGSYINKYMNG